jgi:hypothetical protein
VRRALLTVSIPRCWMQHRPGNDIVNGQQIDLCRQ